MTLRSIALSLIVLMGCVSQEPTGDVANVERISPNGPDGATAKCLALGYESDLLDACVRAIHADFCGDGVSLTSPGVLIDIHDIVGVVSDTIAWVPEAEWTADGAACISSHDTTRFWKVAHVEPQCVIPVSADCGTGAYGPVITKLAPTQI